MSSIGACAIIATPSNSTVQNNSAQDTEQALVSSYSGGTRDRAGGLVAPLSC